MKKRTWVMGGAVLAAILIAGIALYLLPFGGQGQHETVVETTNQVDAHPRPADTWQPAVVDMPIYGGGQVRTGADSRARLELLEGIVRLSADTIFTVKESVTRRGRALTTLSLQEGRLWVSLTTSQPHELTVETGNAVAAVRDTRFSVEVAAGETLVSVAEGQVVLTAQEQSVTVAAGQQTTVQADQPPVPPEPMSDEERTLWATEGEMPEMAPPTSTPTQTPTPTRTPSATPTPNVATFTNPSDFQEAISKLGVPTIIDFEDMDASPVNNTFAGRDPFDGHTYSQQGITFSNPNGFLLYIAPGGLFWNTSNSLSVGQFPFDSNGSKDETDDDLSVTLDPPVVAVGFTLIDVSVYGQDEFVQFADINGNVIRQLPLPQPFSPYRGFVGIISVDRPITRISVAEDATDDDDVNYDDFVFVP